MMHSPFNDGTCGYKIARDGNGWRWRWIEPGEDDDFSSEFDTESAAYRDAARDWDENGGVTCTRLSATLKSKATKLEKGRSMSTYATKANATAIHGAVSRAVDHLMDASNELRDALLLAEQDYEFNDEKIRDIFGAVRLALNLAFGEGMQRNRKS